MNAGADAVVFDLEDSVAAGQKPKARALVAEFLATPGAGALRLVRFNAVQTPDGEVDVELFSGTQGYDGVLLQRSKPPPPSTRWRGPSPAERRPVSCAPATAPRDAARHPPRCRDRCGRCAGCALVFGAEDFTASLAVERTIDGEELSFARAQVVVAAASVGADSIDTVCTDLDDADALRRDCQRAHALGFRGQDSDPPTAG